MLTQRFKIGRRKRGGGRGIEGEGQREKDKGRGRDYYLKIVLCWNRRGSSATEDPTVVASTRVGQIRNTCNSSFQKSDALFLPPQALNSHVHITRNRYINKNNN